MREQYNEHGIEGYYEKFGSTYHNKHAPEIKRALRIAHRRFPCDLVAAAPLRVLDLACGSGEATAALLAIGVTQLGRVDACDPFTYDAFAATFGKEAFHWSFEDISGGVLHERKYDLCVCSFALHLLDASKLFSCCYALASTCTYLLILTPHKRPEIKAEFGWEMIIDLVEERIHIRLYKSLLL
jgi:SAM-dependent methyltransferase